MSRLEDKAIIIFGAAGGIGAATARRVCSEGAQVVLVDINGEGVEATAQGLRAQGYKAWGTQADISKEDDVNAAVAIALGHMGKLTGAFMNAADLRMALLDSDLLAMDMAVFDQTMAVNMRGHVLCARAVLPHLLASGSGACVFTSSGSAQSPGAVRPSYAMSKLSLYALARHIATRWGKEGITANVVSPGFIVTPEQAESGVIPQEMIDHFLAGCATPRIGVVDDVAAMVALLLSEDGRWMTGQTYHVNGGGIMP
ncbi:MAG: SDR family NAD(P)-dependent oxidoreductase [Novosphingobium sp.]|uniref:SDR family NAD(P)-dependent oxidoreductase n=1 Tax=Novosphingobium sp. TaxID=1874826 RepID=UPI003B9C4FD6